MHHGLVLITGRGAGERGPGAKFMSCQVTFFPQESKILKMRNLSRKVRLPLIQVSSTKSQTDSRGSGLKLVMGHICQGSKITLVSVYVRKTI